MSKSAKKKQKRKEKEIERQKEKEREDEFDREQRLLIEMIAQETKKNTLRIQKEREQKRLLEKGKVIQESNDTGSVDRKPNVISSTYLDANQSFIDHLLKCLSIFLILCVICVTGINYLYQMNLMIISILVIIMLLSLFSFRLEISTILDTVYHSSLSDVFDYLKPKSVPLPEPEVIEKTVLESRKIEPKEIPNIKDQPVQLPVAKDITFFPYAPFRPLSSVGPVKTIKRQYEFAEHDELFDPAKGIINLETITEAPAQRINFKIRIKLNDNEPVIAEVDTDSHLSLISEEYFLDVLQKQDIRFIDETEYPSYNGLGSALKSNYPALALTFQIGGIRMSGRFVVASELRSSIVLLGTDIFRKYDMSLVAAPDEGYKLLIGREPIACVPVLVTSKIEASTVFSCKLLHAPIENDTQFEDLLEPGISFDPKVISKDIELNFIRKHPKLTDKNKKKLIDCLEKIPDLYSGSEFSETPFPPEIYQHDIELLDGAPTELTAKPYKLSGIRLDQLKATIQDMVDNKVLEPGDSNYVTPVFFVLKKAGENKTACKGRLCFDYRKLNSIIKPLHFPIKTTKLFFEEASKFKVFSLIDIRNAFLSISLTERAKKLAAIITPFGVYLPTRSPFGLKSSPSAFCAAIDKVISDLRFCTVYMDDIFIGAYDQDDMTNKLIILFNRLAKHNLKIQLTKAKLLETKLKLLGVIFTANVKEIDPDKIKAIQQFPKIHTIKQLQSFLGLLSYISIFIPAFSILCSPLFKLILKPYKQFQMT